MRTFKQKNGFTLAEVLITLGIIGVVAALSIPTLINNYQKDQTITKLKKIYSIITTAVKNSEVENGSMMDWETPSIDGDPTISADWWQKYFTPYSNLSIIKTCNSSTFYECMSNETIWLDGKSSEWSTTLPAYVLNDGTAIKLGGVLSTGASLWVDLNGLKKPNIIGKDLFLLVIAFKKGRVQFDGQTEIRTTKLANCNKEPGTNKGIFCGSLILMDGWQIKEEYPW